MPFENLWKNWTYHGPQGNQQSWEASLAAKKVPQVVAISLGYIEYLSALYHFNYSRKDAQNKQKHLSPGEKINVQQIQGNMQEAAPVIQQKVAHFESDFIKTPFFPKKWEQIKVITEDKNFPEYGVAYYEDSVNKQAGYGQIIIKSKWFECKDKIIEGNEPELLRLAKEIKDIYHVNAKMIGNMDDMGFILLPPAEGRDDSCKLSFLAGFLPPRNAKNEDLSQSHASQVISILTGLQAYMTNNDDMRYTSLAYLAQMDFFLFPFPATAIWTDTTICDFTNLSPQNIGRYDIFISSANYFDGTVCLKKIDSQQRDVIVAGSNLIPTIKTLLETNPIPEFKNPDPSINFDNTFKKEKEALQTACKNFQVQSSYNATHEGQTRDKGIDHRYYTIASGLTLTVNPFKIQWGIGESYDDLLNEFGKRIKAAINIPQWSKEKWLKSCSDAYGWFKLKNQSLLSQPSEPFDIYEHFMKVPDEPYKLITTAHTTTSSAGTSLAQPVFSSILLAIKAFLKIPNRREILLANFTNMLFFNAQQGIDIKSEHKLKRDAEEYLNIIEDLMSSVIGKLQQTHMNYTVTELKDNLTYMDETFAMKDVVNLTMNTTTEYKYGHFMTDASFFAPIAMMCLYDKEWSEHLGLLAKYCNKLTKYNTFRVEQPKLKY